MRRLRFLVNLDILALFPIAETFSHPYHKRLIRLAVFVRDETVSDEFVDDVQNNPILDLLEPILTKSQAVNSVLMAVEAGQHAMKNHVPPGSRWAQQVRDVACETVHWNLSKVGLTDNNSISFGGSIG